MGSVTIKSGESGSNSRRKYVFPVGMQVVVPVNRHKCHPSRLEEILDGYDDFNTYVVVELLRATTNFGCLDVRRHVMTSESSIAVSMIYRNNK